jgi:hypothetical protein
LPKRYTVTGSQPVLDHQPGETFDADLPADQEEFLVGIGALAVEEKWDAEKSEAEYEKHIQALNIKSYTVNGPREEKRR